MYGFQTELVNEVIPLKGHTPPVEDWLSNALVIAAVWLNISRVSQLKLQFLHNNLARTILFADIRTHVDDMMAALEWIKLKDRWENHLLILVFKCLKNLSPAYLSSQFNFIHDYHNYVTRNHSSNTLVVPKFK